MTNRPIDRPWDWKVLTIECPVCYASIAPDAATSHAAWHWGFKTIPEEIE